MIALLTIIHVVVCFFLVLVVLLQQGKGQDFASTFGGGGTQTAFGARSATTVLHRLTTVAAILFMVTSLSLTILISRPNVDSVITDEALPAEGAAAQPTSPEETAPVDVTPPAEDTGSGTDSNN